MPRDCVAVGADASAARAVAAAALSPQTTCKLAFDPAPDEDWDRWNVLGLNELLLRDCSGGLIKFKPSSTHTDFGGHPLENLADGAVDGTTKMLANFVQPPLVLTLDLILGSDVHRNVCGYEMIGYDHRYPKGSWSFACEGRGKLHSYSVAQSGDPFVSGIASFFFGDDDVTAATNGACSTFPSAKYPDCASFDKATGYDPHACVSLSCGVRRCLPSAGSTSAAATGRAATARASAR